MVWTIWGRCGISSQFWLLRLSVKNVIITQGIAEIWKCNYQNQTISEMIVCECSGYYYSQIISFHRQILLNTFTKIILSPRIILAAGNTDWPVYYLSCKSNNIPWYPHSCLHIPVWGCFGQVVLITILSQEINFLFRWSSSHITQWRFCLLLLLFCNLSLGRREMPNQEVSGLSALQWTVYQSRPDSVLLFEASRNGNFPLLQRDVAGLFYEYFFPLLNIQEKYKVASWFLSGGCALFVFTPV